MTEVRKQKVAGLTPAKGALIGVLALILLTVIVIQIPWSTAVPAAKRTKPNRPQNRTSANVRPVNRQSQPAITDSNNDSHRTGWPEFSLQLVQSHDPFATPVWLVVSSKFDTTDNDGASEGNVDEDRDADKALLAELKMHGVSLVMITGDERLAMVGQTELRIGDRIGRFLVQEITTDGVTLVEHDAP